MKFKIRRRKHNIKGNLSWEYNPLRNLETINSNNKKVLTDFDTKELALDINHPIDIECQTSYDGSTNIIFNDDLNPPRIVNSSFSVKEDNTFERVLRNQRIPTNIYREKAINSETRLQRVTSVESKFLSVDFKEICGGGELPGGNYVFLIQYADEDDNISKIMAESGIISVFGGHLAKPYTTYSTLLHEKTDKMIKFNLLNVDESFSKVYISYRRDYCDLNGVKQSEYKKLTNAYKITGSEVQIVIDGREPSIDISYNKLIETPNVYQKVKTQTQNQNMLFFGNVEETYDNIVALQKLALDIQVQPVWGDSVGYLDQDSYEAGLTGSEYFNTHNIYDNLGYMPEEFYRIGIVFVYNDDTRSNVYNLRGCTFTEMYQWNYLKGDNSDPIDINELFLNKHTSLNTKGVFRMPDVNLYATENISPIRLHFKMPLSLIPTLKKLNIKGYYYVRQARIPIFLAQGFSIGVSNSAYIPLLSVYNVDATDESNSKQINFGTDSIFVQNDQSPDEYNKKEKKKDNGKVIHLTPTRTTVSTKNVSVRGLICPDAILNPQLQSLFCGSRHVLKNIADYQSTNLFVISDPNQSEEYDIIKKVNLKRTKSTEDPRLEEKELIFIPPESSYRSYKKSVFSTKAGSSVDIKSLRSVNPESDTHSFKINSNCVRGNYIPFVGVVSKDTNTEDELLPNTVYNIYSEEYSNKLEPIRNSIQQRSFDRSEFTAICDIQSIWLNEGNTDLSVECARGDCFTCTSQHKFSYNFLDHNAPLNETQVKAFIEYKEVGKNEDEPASNQFFKNTIDEIDASAWLEWNSSDANTVDFGQYVSLKYISNFNNIRAIDQQKLDELSLYGSPRQFFPLTSHTKGIAFKIPDSTLVNFGLSTTRLLLPHFEAVQVPYINSMFDNRVAFSNMSSTSSFSNGYRVFSGVSYQDIERTYGAIVKLLPYGAHLFCIFEHGCGIIPVNEKALLSTATGQSIHMYGAGVLQEQVTVVSQDYGSTWEESIIVTPNGIYGVDTWAKKIWRYNANGFELISDQVVQRFLNDNLSLSESDWFPTIALKNVKTHYNNHKGDVMFTFYKDDKCWNLCYNERIGKFTTRYSWTPLISGNIQNSFVSVDRDAVVPYAFIAENSTLTRGVKLNTTDRNSYTFDYVKEDIQYNYIADCQLPITENTCKFSRSFKLVGYDPCNSMMAHIKSISYATWDDALQKETIHTVVNDTEHGFWIDPHDVVVSIPMDEDEEHGEEEKIETNENGDLVLNKTTSSKYKVSVIGWGQKKTPVDLNTVITANTLNQNEYYHEEFDGTEDDNEKDFIKFNNFRAQWPNYVACGSDTNLSVEVKLDQFISWIRIDLNITPMVTTLDKPADEWASKTITCSAQGDPFTQSLYFVANYDFIKSKAASADHTIAKEYLDYKNIHDNTLRVGFYTHGRAGIYDELNYDDLNEDNQIKPTLWYNKQEPFEFEFVVNTPAGYQKIFDNLVLISNNAEPESLEISLIGDAYDFNKANIFKASKTTILPDPETGILNTEKLHQQQLKVEYTDRNKSQNFDVTLGKVTFNTKVTRDPVLNQYCLTVHDDCRNVKEWGKRLGNIEYREDKWLVTLSPIMFKNTFASKTEDGIVVSESNINSAKLRDKWCKIRIKYKGDKLVVISAIQTFMSLSFS